MRLTACLRVDLETIGSHVALRFRELLLLHSWHEEVETMRSDDGKPEFLEDTVEASMRGRAPIWVLAFGLFMGIFSCHVIIAMVLRGAPYTIPGLGADAAPISQVHAPYAFGAQSRSMSSSVILVSVASSITAARCSTPRTGSPVAVAIATNRRAVPASAMSPHSTTTPTS